MLPASLQPRRATLRRTGLATLAGLALLTAPALASAAPAAGSPAPPTTVLTIDGHATTVIDGPFITTGATTFAHSITSATLTGPGTGGLTGTVTLTMPGGQPLAVGSYPAKAVADATNGGISVEAKAGKTCASESGSFTIHEVVKDAGGAVTTFAASYADTCDGQGMVGEIRHNSTIDYIRFGEVALDASTSQVVTITAPTAQTLGQAALSGALLDTFAVTTDTCSGASLAAAATCTITLAAWPGGLAPNHVFLTVPVTGGGATHVVTATLMGKDTASGGYAPVDPARLLDTRKAIGITTTTPVGASADIPVQITGRGRVPTGIVSAAVINLTVVNPTGGGYLTTYPSGTSRPTTSSINFAKAVTRANLVTVPVGSDGRIRIFNGASATHILVDVMGYYTNAASPTTAAGGRYGNFRQFALARVLDTRTPAGGGVLPGGYTMGVAMGSDPVTTAQMAAVAVTVTVVSPRSNGYISVWDYANPDALPATSAINFVKGTNTPNMTVVPVSKGVDAQGTYVEFGIYNGGAGDIHLLVDVVGYYDHNEEDAGRLRFRPATSPVRIIDTRSNLGMQKLGPASSRPVAAPPTVAGANTLLLVGNVTAIRPTSSTYLTMWTNEPGVTQPRVSNLNPYAGEVVGNMAMPQLFTANDFRIYNAAGSTDVTYDVAGGMEMYPAVGPPFGSGIADTRPAPTSGPGAATDARTSTRPTITTGTTTSRRPAHG